MIEESPTRLPVVTMTGKPDDRR